MPSFGIIARIKAPEGYKGVWINIYKTNFGAHVHTGGAYRTRKQADNIAKPYRHDCVYVHVKLDN